MLYYVALFWFVQVGSIDGAAQASGIPPNFVSAILLPIAGNAAEHASAIIFAYKNRLDISLGVSNLYIVCLIYSEMYGCRYASALPHRSRCLSPRCPLSLREYR